MIYKETVKVEKGIVEKFQNLLNKNRIDFEKEEVEKDATLFSKTIKFSNEAEADIKVCSGQSNLFVDAILITPKGREIVNEPSEELLGKYYFFNGADEYIITVKEE